MEEAKQKNAAQTKAEVLSQCRWDFVHQEDLRNDNDTDTAVGISGEWSIQLELIGVTGTLNFRVQRKT